MSAFGLLLIGGGLGAYLGLARRLRQALEPSRGSATAFTFNAVATPASVPQHWGGGQVDALAASASGLITAGGFGVADGAADLSPGLPTLHASALTLWRGHPIVGLAAGGLFLRREGRWEEARSAQGTLHVRDLLEAPGGELWIGAQEGLFRAAWGATTLERLDGSPVRSLALGEGGTLLAGGECGLRALRGSQISLMPTPDPWVDWVGLSGGEVLVITPLGLARGSAGQPLLPDREGGEARSAALLGSQLFVVAERSLFRFEGRGRAVEERIPSEPRRVFSSAGMLFADTAAGLYRRGDRGWILERPRPASLPPGPCHVTALGLMDSQLVVGLFDGGIAVEALKGGAFTQVPGSAAWGINALLPAGGTLYVASLRGAARLDGGQLRPLLNAEGGAAFSLAATHDGVAIGFGQGLLLPSQRFLSAFHGLPGNQALALLQDRDLLFVGTPTGLGAVGGGRVAWRVTTGEGKLPHPWVTALAGDGEALLIGTYGGGVTRRTPPKEGTSAPGSFDPFPETEGLKVNPGCLVQAGGRLYLGTDGRGLYRLSRDRSHFLRLDLTLPSSRITALLPDRDALYVGTEEGLARIPLPIADEEP